VYSITAEASERCGSELKQRLIEVWCGLQQTVVDDWQLTNEEDVSGRVAVKEQQFEHLL